MICGAGGGTVDLVSYTITRLRPILGVEEAAPGFVDNEPHSPLSCTKLC